MSESGPSMHENLVGIALGSNVGDRAQMLHAALQAIAQRKIVTHIRTSFIYETLPVGKRAGGNYFNAVIVGDCQLTPEKLLASCMSIEQSLGRNRALEGQGGPRTLDLDILFMGQRVAHENGLQLPHPRMFLRSFVLQPLADIAPDLLLPTQKESVHSLFQSLSLASQTSVLGERVGLLCV